MPSWGATVTQTIKGGTMKYLAITNFTVFLMTFGFDRVAASTAAE